MSRDLNTRFCKELQIPWKTSVVSYSRRNSSLSIKTKNFFQKYMVSCAQKDLRYLICNVVFTSADYLDIQSKKVSWFLGMLCI